jgi:SAM-dependent methyltransferase
VWDKRYSGEGFLFGTEPAAFVKAHVHLLTPGQTALCVADGEGRNSVFLAEQGLAVTAMDASPVGVEKARRLAAERGVSIDFRIADVLSWEWIPNSYDIVLAVFIQFLTPDERSAVFEGMKRTLRPGGYLLLHGYQPEQVDYATGGPPYRENMYTADLLRQAFGDLSIERLAAYDTIIKEGTGHDGMSALIDLVAKKA